MLSQAQSGTVKKISLADAISIAITNNASLKSHDRNETLVAEVETAYFNLVCQQNRYAKLKQQAYLLNDLERVANLRYEAGDIDVLEKTEMISRLADIRTSISMLNDDMAISANKLKLLLHTADDLIPADSVLSMYALKKRNEAPSELDTAARFVSEKNRENLVFALNSCFRKLQYFQQVALGKADELLEINRIKYEKEEIDYTEYTARIDEAFRIQLEYLETLNKYNQTAIQLELYAY
jgi:outer membrane protein TolC